MKNIHMVSEDGFVDLSFDIVRFEEHQNAVDEKFYKLEINAGYEDNIVSLIMDIINDGVDTFTAYNQDGEKIETTLSAGRLAISSSGEQSDYFVKILSKLYGTETKPQKMKETIYSVCIALEGYIENIKTEKLKLKCFFNDGSHETDNEELYAEVYINIDLKNKALEIVEKDMDYRENIINTFSA